VDYRSALLFYLIILCVVGRGERKTRRDEQVDCQRRGEERRGDERRGEERRGDETRRDETRGILHQI
jgi:hypothetical protein